MDKLRSTVDMRGKIVHIYSVDKEIVVVMDDMFFPKQEDVTKTLRGGARSAREEMDPGTGGARANPDWERDQEWRQSIKDKVKEVCVTMCEIAGGAAGASGGASVGGVAGGVIGGGVGAKIGEKLGDRLCD